ncbi:type II toxin-antitoxin system HipA family toxin [Promicromonospora sp. Populi]|uniref:type II toxin-antitoxin system HipA family toxin n=1 Tax=Promicromonospora sp. Populi TaxID=3239420 RepID=UPI0034E2D407
MKQLAVILGGRHVAELTRTRAGVLRLTYLDDARSVGATPLSLSLPPGIASHAGAPVVTFLRGLLPESDPALDAIGRRYRIDTRDELALLSVVGKDCAGAVQFCVEDEIEATIRREGSLQECSAGDIEIRLDEMDTDESASWTMPGEHWSLGGTQQKFALRRQDDRWYVAQGAEATTHIIKPGIRKMKAQALDEHVSMRTARIVGIDAAHTEYTSFKSQDAIVVSRFDRLRVDGDQVVRLHQEDLCQALGDNEKYESEGGPSALGIIRMLREVSETAGSARRNVERFVDGLIYNTVIGAPDAHARNYAVLLDGDSVDLAPIYDVASGFAYDPPTGGRRVVSMSVGGMFELDEIGRDAWSRFADAAGLDVDHTVGRVAELAALVPDAIETALEDLDDYEGHVAALGERLLGELAARRSRQPAS